MYGRHMLIMTKWCLIIGIEVQAVGVKRCHSSSQLTTGEVGSVGAKEFGSLTRKVRKMRQRLAHLRAQSVGRGLSDEEKAITKKLWLALKQEKIIIR